MTKFLRSLEKLIMLNFGKSFMRQEYTFGTLLCDGVQGVSKKLFDV